MAHLGPTEPPGGPHVGPMNFAIRDASLDVLLAIDDSVFPYHLEETPSNPHLELLLFAARLAACPGGISLIPRSRYPGISTVELLCFNTLRPRRNGQKFPDDIFKRIFFSMKMFAFRLKFY